MLTACPPLAVLWGDGPDAFAHGRTVSRRYDRGGNSTWLPGTLFCGPSKSARS